MRQPETWQYPPIPIPQPPGSGRRRKARQRSRRLLIGLVALAVLLVGSGITLLARSLGNDEPTATQTPTTTPTSQPSETPSPTPPPKPNPNQQAVEANKLYTVGPLASARCVQPVETPVNFPGSRNFYNKMLACLNRTWSLAAKKAGIAFRPPKAVVYTGVISSPCGPQRHTRAAYCATNQTLYFPYYVDNSKHLRNKVYARVFMLNTFAHEYGHHIQQLAGILPASLARQNTMTPNSQLLESRRRELQAACFGSAYLGADAGTLPMRGPLKSMWIFLVAHSGDDYSRPRTRTHGNRVSHYQWSTKGFNSRNPASCNTFTADPKLAN